MKKVLLKDIVIPKGTVFSQSAEKTERFGGNHFGCTVGLSKDTFGDLDYCFDDAGNDLDEYFTDLKE